MCVQIVILIGFFFLGLGWLQNLDEDSLVLAPAWSAEGVVASDSEQALAKSHLLDALLSEKELPLDSRWIARVVPHLTLADGQRCVAVLRSQNSSQPAMRRARDLLLAGRDSGFGEMLATLALDPSVSSEWRMPFLLRRLRLGGSLWRQKAAASLVQEDHFMLRVLAEECSHQFLEQDRTILQSIAGSSNARTAMTALVGWAEKEADPRWRMHLFEQVFKHSPARGRRLLGALAQGGPHKKIQLRLAAELASPNSERRALAEDFLPSFLEAKSLVEVYRGQLDPQLHPRLRAQRMVRLARLPLPAARSLAAHWLADGGWREDRLGRQVAILLSSGLDPGPAVERLFETPSVPSDILRPLALGRAEQSSLARKWLRQQVGVHKGDVSIFVRALGKSEDVVDLHFLAELLADSSVQQDARASACEGLARFSSFHPLLRERIQDPTEDYLVVEAALRSLIRSGNQEQRQELFQGWIEVRSQRPEDEALGLLLAELDAREHHALASEAPALATQLALLLSAVSPDMPPVPPNPRQGAGRFPRVHACGRAFAAALHAGGQANLEIVEPVSVAAALHLLALLPAHSGEALALAVLHQEGLPDSARLRALAALLRIQVKVAPQFSELTLRALLSNRPLLDADPRNLAFGLGEPGAIAWVLPEDRLAERIPLLKEWPNPAALVAAFDSWREGSPSPQALVQANAKLVAAGRPQAGLTLLARGVDLHCEDPQLRLALAQALQLKGRLAEAGRNYAVVARFAFPGSKSQEEAERGMRACGYDAD